MALNAGISPFSFWEQSIDEDIALINAYQNRIQRENKEMAIQNSVLATQILIGLHNMMSKKEEAITKTNLWDFFPDLFVEEKKAYEKLQKDNEVFSVKESRYAYANKFNKKFRKKGDGE